MSFPAYPSYKDSEVAWLGAVPAHWEVLPCRAIVLERTAKNENAACGDYLSLMANIGVIPYAEKGDIGNKKPEDLSKCKVVTRGDFVINSMNYGIGSYGLSEYDGVCSSVYIVLKPLNEIVESRFAFRIFENRAFQTYAQSFGNGILEHRCAINWDILKAIGVGVPPISEQTAILDFLDHETTKIDALVDEQRRLIELLKEKRQAVILQAVTKGLNPNVPMKDSGVTWLGKVPAHWQIAPLGRVTSERCDGPFGSGIKSSHYTDEGALVVRLQNIRSGRFNLGEPVYLDADYFESELAGHAVSGGDVLIAGLGDDNNLLGRACVAPPNLGPALVKADCFRFRLDGSMCPEFLAYQLSAGAAFDAGQLATGTTRSRIPLGTMASRKVAYPPKEEQEAIRGKIEEWLAALDELACKAEDGIALLHERRAALISAAVTGKIDVRGAILKPAVQEELAE